MMRKMYLGLFAALFLPTLAVAQSLPQPKVITQAPGTNNNLTASTAYVDSAIQVLLGSLASNSALALKAPLASPAFTGTPTAPTAAPGTNSTRLATTAYADAIKAATDIVLATKANQADMASSLATKANQTDLASLASATLDAVNGKADTADLAAEVNRAKGVEAGLAPTSNPTFTGVVNAPQLNLTGGNSTGPIGGMSVGGVTLGNAVTSIFTKLTPFQVADAVAGNASLDVSSTISTAFNNCNPKGPPRKFTFPAGAYSFASPVRISCPVDIYLDAGSNVKMTASYGNTRNGQTILRQGIFEFAPGSEGSILHGPGFIDGNRENLVNQYLSIGYTGQVNGISVIPYVWSCVLIDATARITIDGVNFRGCMSFGVEHAAGDDVKLSNLTFYDMADMLESIYSNRTTWTNIKGIRIGNNINGQAIPWTYASGGNDNDNFTVNGLSIDGYEGLIYDGTSAAPGKRISDPTLGFFMFQRIRGGNFSNLRARGFTHNDGRSTQVVTGTVCDNCQDTVFSGLNFAGVYYGINIPGGKNVSVDNFLVDCQYNVAPFYGQEGNMGIWAGNGGQIRGYAGLDSSYDHVANTSSAGTRFSNGRVTRCLTGAAVFNSNTTLSNLEITGNTGSGIVAWAHQKFYPGATPFPVEDIRITNVKSTYNDGHGLLVNDGLNVKVDGLIANNNGQNCATTFACNGIHFNVGFGGLKSQWWFNGWQAIDNQSTPITETVSYRPGSTDANNKFQVVMTRSSAVHVGQRITLVNAAGAGNNISGKVTDITEDTVTLQTSGAATYAAAGLSAQTGTVAASTSSPNILNGTGTSWTTSIKGPAYILVGSTYYKIGQVISDTQIQLDTAVTSSFSGQSYQLMQVAVQGIPSQQIGFSAAADPNISNISLGSSAAYQTFGNIQSNISTAPASIYNDWTNYTPTIGIAGGSGVTTVSGGSYKLDGKTLFVKGFVQINYTGSAPTGLNFNLPAGLVSSGGGTVLGFNASNANILFDGVANSSNIVALLPRSSVVTASGQYIQYNGTMQVQ